jgi:multiple sugar transport system substrate-binding protein
MKKVLLALIITTLFVACQKKGTQQEGAGSGPITLEFYTWMDEEPYMTKLVDQWNKENPDIQIHASFPGNLNEYIQKLTVALSGGSTIDVFCLTNPGEAGEFINLGQAKPLDDLIAKIGFDESGVAGFLDSFRAELGKVYGLPYRKSIWTLFYNKKLFDEAGIPYPVNYTWEKYTEVGRHLTKGSGQDRVYGILNYQPTSGWWRIAANVTGANNPIETDDLAEFKKAAKLVWDWSYTYQCQPPYSERTGTAGGDYAGSFSQGKFGMTVCGDWLINMLNNNNASGANLDYDIANCPYWEGDEPYSAGVPTLSIITNTSKHPEEAFKFIAYLSGLEGAKFLAGEGLVPAWSSPEIRAIFGKQVSSPKNLDALFMQKTYSQAPFDPDYNPAMRIVNQEMSLYFLNEQDLDKTYDTIAMRIKEEIE